LNALRHVEAEPVTVKQAPQKQAAKPAPIPPPASPPELTKEQKLADLLRRYEADEITPYQYHMERAKIVAEP
jgi:hypothetical protein